MRKRLIVLTLIICSTAVRAQQPPARSPQEILDRAVEDFSRGRFEESVALFDELIKIAPSSRPQLWQRGIALYYAGRFDECRAQFELHRTVNPDDVENAAWHFLCVARGQSPEHARAALLPVGPDSRVPMTQVYAMLRGNMTPAQVLSSAGGNPSARFYAELYVGLYGEAIGRNDLALEHITVAAADQYASVGGYMHMVARVHRTTLQGK